MGKKKFLVSVVPIIKYIFDLECIKTWDSIKACDVQCKNMKVPQL